MTESEQYYYEKGKAEGFIEGTQKGNEFIVEHITKTDIPQMIVLNIPADTNVLLLTEKKEKRNGRD